MRLQESNCQAKCNTFEKVTGLPVLFVEHYSVTRKYGIGWSEGAALRRSSRGMINLLCSGGWARSMTDLLSAKKEYLRSQMV